MKISHRKYRLAIVLPMCLVLFVILTGAVFTSLNFIHLRNATVANITSDRNLLEGRIREMYNDPAALIDQALSDKKQESTMAFYSQMSQLAQSLLTNIKITSVFLTDDNGQILYSLADPRGEFREHASEIRIGAKIPPSHCSTRPQLSNLGADNSLLMCIDLVQVNSVNSPNQLQNDNLLRTWIPIESESRLYVVYQELTLVDVILGETELFTTYIIILLVTAGLGWVFSLFFFNRQLIRFGRVIENTVVHSTPPNLTDLNFVEFCEVAEHMWETKVAKDREIYDLSIYGASSMIHDMKTVIKGSHARMESLFDLVRRQANGGELERTLCEHFGGYELIPDSIRGLLDTKIGIPQTTKDTIERYRKFLKIYERDCDTQAGFVLFTSGEHRALLQKSISRVNIKTLFDDIYTYYLGTTKNERYKLVFIPDPNEFVYYVVHEFLVRQAIAHFIRNAIKHNDDVNRDANSSIIVIRAKTTISQQNPHLATLTFEVIDYGSGISVERQDHLFGRHVDENLMSANAQNGLGVGLYTMSKMARELNAVTELVETEINVGSKFHLVLNDVEHSPRTRYSECSDIKVGILVHGDLKVGKLVSEFFTDAGYFVTNDTHDADFLVTTCSNELTKCRNGLLINSLNTKMFSLKTDGQLRVLNESIALYEVLDILAKLEPKSPLDVVLSNIEGEIYRQGNVLFVEDQHTTLSLMTKHLQSLGLKVFSYTNSVEALSAYSASPEMFDFFVLDQMLDTASMSGSSLLNALNAIDPRPSIAYSANTKEQIQASDDSCSFDYFVGKNASERDLLNTLAKLISDHMLPITLEKNVDLDARAARIIPELKMLNMKLSAACDRNSPSEVVGVLQEIRDVNPLVPGTPFSHLSIPTLIDSIRRGDGSLMFPNVHSAITDYIDEYSGCVVKTDLNKIASQTPATPYPVVCDAPLSQSTLDILYAVTYEIRQALVYNNNDKIICIFDELARLPADIYAQLQLNRITYDMVMETFGTRLCKLSVLQAVIFARISRESRMVRVTKELNDRLCAIALDIDDAISDHCMQKAMVVFDAISALPRNIQDAIDYDDRFIDKNQEQLCNDDCSPVKIIQSKIVLLIGNSIIVQGGDVAPICATGYFTDFNSTYTDLDKHLADDHVLPAVAHSEIEDSLLIDFNKRPTF
jgi:signal transduction histidine kinase/CheY-like chemotaxis protein